MKNLIALSKTENFLFKNLKPLFLGSDYEIIRIKVYDKNKKIIQIMIDHSSKIINIDDCAKYARLISDLLDKKNLIPEDYNLEVSSPGIERPLTRLKDFHKFKGSKVKVTEINLEENEIFHKGIITEVTKSRLILDQENNPVSIELNKIKDAKLLS